MVLVVLLLIMTFVMIIVVGRFLLVMVVDLCGSLFVVGLLWMDWLFNFDLLMGNRSSIVMLFGSGWLFMSLLCWCCGCSSDLSSLCRLFWLTLLLRWRCFLCCWSLLDLFSSFLLGGGGFGRFFCISRSWGGDCNWCNYRSRSRVRSSGSFWRSFNLLFRFLRSRYNRGGIWRRLLGLMLI